MSDQTTVIAPTSDEATETVAPEWVYDPTIPGDDSSRVSEPEKMLALLPDWQKDAGRAVTEYKRFSGATSLLAERRVDARSLILLPNGFPDWAADSDAYKQAVRAGESAAMAKLTKDAARQLGNATKQKVRRVFLVPGVVSWVLTHENGFGDEAAKFFGDPENSVAGDPDSVLSNPSDALKHRVRAHFAAAGLKLDHPAFREKTADTSAGPDPKDPENPLEGFRGGLGSLSQITPRFSVAAILETVSAISASLIETRDKEIEGRPEIMDALLRVSVIAQETAYALDTTQGGKYDADALVAASYDEKKDAAK